MTDANDPQRGRAVALAPGDGDGVAESAVVRALRDYRNALASDRRPMRAELLARYPAIASELSACLDAIEFIESAAAQLPPSVDAAQRQADAQAEGLAGSMPLGDFRIIR